MTIRYLFALVAALTASVAFAEDTDPQSHSGFGGPNAVPNQIESDALAALKGWGTSAGENWDAWKKGLQDNYGFGLF